MEKVCIIAQFPPPMHGLSKAVDTLYRSELSKDFRFEKIDIKNNSHILKTLVSIHNSDADLFYFTISQSRLGNLRDLMILRTIGDRPCLIHLHGGYYRHLVEHEVPEWQKMLNYKAIGKLRGAIVLGPSLKHIFEGMLPDDKIFVVPNCVDNDFLMSDDEFEEKVSTMNQRTVKHVLYLSNFIRSKGYPEVLEMAKLEKERVENGYIRKFHFDFAGKFFKKDDESFFYDYISVNGLDSYVTYHGVVGGDKKRNLLRMSDFFVLLTTYPNEGQPISILEAMENGLAVVTTDHAGIPDIVNSGTGIIFKKNTENIAVKAFEAINNKNLLEQIKFARHNIRSYYIEKYYLLHLKEVLSNILNDKTISA